MVYRNPYHGYSDNEYGYHQEQNHGTEHLYGYQGGHGQIETGAGHHGTQGRSGGQVADSWGVNATYNASTYRVQNPSSPPSGSQQNLLKSKSKSERWPRGSDFLASTWAFTLSLHSLWSLPIVIIQHGGLVFLLIYMLLLAILGAPLLLLEMFLGQYSGLAPIRVFRHLSPVLTGLGLAMCIQASLRAVLELGVSMWLGQGMFRLFYQQTIREEMFEEDILNKEDSSLESLGALSTQLLLVLGIAALTVFVLVVAGTRAVGKVCMVAVPACYMLLVTLVIRTCLCTGGPQGVLTFLRPEWSLLKEPTIWLEAASQVIFSLQLGLGAITAYARYSSFRHNIVRDSIIIMVSHLVWVLLAMLLTFSLLGVATSTEQLSIGEGSEVIVSITGHGVWLAGQTLLEKALMTISYGWLWAGLYFLLLTAVSVTSLFGYLEIITSSLASIRPGFVKLKPIVTFIVLALIFLMTISLATQGGIHVYHLLLTYISAWPVLLFSLLAVLATTLCHGTNYLMKDLADMSKLSLPHWVTSHLSVIYTTVLPIFLSASLGWVLYILSLDHLEEPLATFGLSLPQHWGILLGWSLSALPVLPLVLGVLVRLAWVPRGVPLTTHLKVCHTPTDHWYKNEHRNIARNDTDV